MTTLEQINEAQTVAYEIEHCDLCAAAKRTARLALDLTEAAGGEFAMKQRFPREDVAGQHELPLVADSTGAKVFAGAWNL